MCQTHEAGYKVVQQFMSLQIEYSGMPSLYIATESRSVYSVGHEPSTATDCVMREIVALRLSFRTAAVQKFGYGDVMRAFQDWCDPDCIKTIFEYNRPIWLYSRTPKRTTIEHIHSSLVMRNGGPLIFGSSYGV